MFLLRGHVSKNFPTYPERNIPKTTPNQQFMKEFLSFGGLGYANQGYAPTRGFRGVPLECGDFETWPGRL